jgi:glycosyltransferase involved in cell wall biosynthesis
MCMNDNDGPLPAADGRPLPGDDDSLNLLIATILRPEGTTGVHTHFQQLFRYLEGQAGSTTIITPFSRARPLTVPVFGLRLALMRCSKAASVAWYRHGHEAFLRHALRRALARPGDCVVYAQCPLAARAALRARRGPHQRVVMAVHFRISQADEWADKKQIRRDGSVFRGIRQLEREVIPRVDGLMYVSQWARNALVEWLPEAAAIPSGVITNFVVPPRAGHGGEPLADLVSIGHLEPVKNHRYLLQVLAEARQAGRSFTLDVYGEGPLLGDLRRQARSLSLDTQVRFRGFRPDVRDLLPRYRAYAHVSYSESSSLAIIEAMAAGLPIFAGNIGPIAELCDDGAEARFWPLDNPRQAAATLTQLLDCEPARLTAARAATRRFYRDFDAGVVGPRLRSFLLSMAPPAPQRTAVPGR